MTSERAKTACGTDSPTPVSLLPPEKGRNVKQAPPLSASEMQRQLALALVILSFEERVASEARDLRDLDQQISCLQQQYQELQAQREKDTDYLERSIRQLYPALPLTVSEGGQLEIPAELRRQLHQLQQNRPQPLLTVPTSMSSGEQESAGKLPEVQASSESRSEETPSNPKISDEESAIDPRAKEVIEYAFAHAESAGIGWKTTVQRALQLPEPPKMKGHAVFKALQRAYQLLESMHDGTIFHPSDTLTAFYTLHFIEGEQWGELKDILLQWAVISS